MFHCQDFTVSRSMETLEFYCGKAHGNPYPFSSICGEFGNLYAYYLDCICCKLSLHLLCSLYSQQYLVLLCQSWARPCTMQAESHGDNSTLFQCSFKVQNPSLLFLLILKMINIYITGHIVMSLQTLKLSKPVLLLLGWAVA